jgi:hypothetical protein
MSRGEPWAWLVLLLLGCYHGINPGMGWLFAVALGMQERSSRAVGWSLVPIALGHGLAIGWVVLLAGLIQTILPLNVLKISIAAILFALGLYRLWRNRHPRWGGMQVGFRDLTIWSFLMASAHGAGLMVLPVLLKILPGESAQLSLPPNHHHLHNHSLESPITGLLATGVHTLGYLVVTGLVAILVYEKFGLALLRNAWLNLDLVWAVALIVTGCLTLLI